MMVKKPFYGVLLILLIALLGAIAGTQAQGQPGSSFVAPVMYEVVLANDDPAEVEKCNRLGCGNCVTKPVGYEQFVEAIKKLGLFLMIVEVPPLKSEPGVVKE